MTIISNYRLLEKIAETPQAQIFKTCNKNDPDRLLTLKILKTDGLSGSKKAGFRQKIEHLKVLNDPRVITPLVFSDRDGICFIAQDYFDGITLQEFLGGAPGLPLEEYLTIAIGVASALEKVHEAGIVHGGIKPHNILVDPETLEIRLIDFVSSVDVRDVSHFIYDRSFIRDTLSYTSPEQTGRISHRVGFPSDLYSLGVVFYEMLTGRLPFASDDPLELIHSHLAEEAPAVRDANPGVPVPLDGIVARLLLKEPEKRYQSCTGLLADLVRCRDEYEATGTIAEFPLERDLGANRMTFVSRMVGRDEEARVILDEYEQVAEGAFRSLLISGLSGIGKTRLIQELQKPIVKHRGYFASGKFDVYQRNIPYSSLLQAIRTLVRTFLTESDARVALWKLRISEAIGKNGRVLTDVIPELEVLIGPQPEVGPLPPVESLNRFHDVFDLFLGSLASRENPLTLFIDDLQWCDSASFDFLANIFANYGDHPHLFLLGAYRHNEVDPSHPLSRLIRQARENGQPLKEIRLGPLRPEHCHEMVSYILDAPLDETCSLSEFISTLTEGNPLFVSESLSYLYNEDLLHLDSERQWRWDLQRIGRSRMPTSIVALFGSKIRKLPPDLVDLLEYCACMGNTFSPVELAAIRGMTLLEVFETLKPALNQGLLIESKNQLQFIHDKVQEATLAAIPAELRRRIHWQVGTHLLSAAPDGEELERRENLFTIASHLNLGRDERPDPATAYLLSNINYHAGNRALDALATEAANEYLRLGRELLPDDCWADDHYERTYRIYQKAAKAELMCGQYESSERLLDSLLEHARTDLDRAECLAEQTTSLSSIGNFIKAIETANRGLAIFDEAIPGDGDEADRRRTEMLAGIDARGIDVWETIRQMPFTTERASTIELAFYSELIPDLYMSGLVPQLYLSAVQSTRHCLAGGMDESVIYSFSIMGLMLGEQGDFDRAFRYEDLARELSALYPNTFGATRGMNGIVWCNMHSRSHPHEIAEYCLRAIQSGKNCGDLYNAGLSYGPLMWNLQVQGADLPVIEEYARECLQFSNRYHLSFSVGLAEAMQAGWVEPMKREYVPVPMEERLERWERENHIASAGSYFVHRALVHYYLGEHNEARDCLAAVRKYLSGLTDNVLKRQWYVFRVLNALKLYEAGDGAASREELFAEIGPVVEQVEVWAGLGPLLRPYLALVRAELERVTGDLREARGLYLDAIELAHRQGYVLLEGHLNECLGDALVRDGQRTGRLYLVEAERLYRQCRAERMLLNLVERHPAIFEAEVSLSSAETEASAGILPNLDIEYLMKSAFAISAEIEQEALLKKVMNVVIESSGAQHGYLLIAEGEDLVIRAESHAADKETVQTPDKRLEEADDICKAIVRYVHRTRQPLILNDAAREGVFKDNPEVQALQVRSVLCLPVVTQSKMTGVLYLENRLADAVFTSARTDMTALLISQAAISLENATLFAERVRAQEALRETSEYLENLIDYANAPIIVWDTALRITRFNRAFERLTGRRSADVLGRPLECLFPEEGMEASLGYIGRTSSGEHWDAVEIPILRTDGSVSTVLWNSANIYNRDGTAVVATIAQGQDITDRKQAELDLHEYAQRLKQSNEDLEYFAYISSHDLQEPLRAISGFAELLERRYKGELDEKADRYINFITDGTRQMQQVIQDLLAYSRVQTKVQEFNLIDTDEALDRALSNLQPVIGEKGAVITRDPLPRVFADGTQITQLFQNLVGNALKFQTPGTTPVIRITAAPDGDRQVFSVADNGIGIDPRFAERIFKIFQRLHAKGEYDGTGIGLAICRRIVERHGGAIEVESEPGAGSTFSFSIPFSQGGAPVNDPGRPPTRMRPIEILLVEDSPADIALTQEALLDSKLHNNLHVVTDGMEALAFLRREGAYREAPVPDLVLLDLNLPKMTGREVLAEIKGDTILCVIPVVIMTVSRDEQDVMESYRLHANCYIRKPVRFGEFIEIVQSIEDFWFSIVTLPAGVVPPDMKILVVEDNPAFAELVREVLLAVPGEIFEIASAGDLSSASALLAAEEIGAVLLDLGLPDSQGIETVRAVRAEYPGVPIVVLTGLDDEETGLRALHEGAQDYLTKDGVTGPSLARSIRYALERSGVRKELIRKNAELEAAYGVLAAHEEELRQSVAELSRAERRLRESAHLLMKAQEIAHLGSWEYTPPNNRVVWSDEVYRILGLPLHEPALDYGEFLELVHADDRCAVDAAYRGSLEEAESGYEVEFRLVRESDGEVRHVHERCEHFRDETGAVLRSVGMIHDITERKQAAGALEEYAEILKGSNEDLERFAYVCSHDLQEPLRSIVSFSQLLERRYRGKLDADADEYIGFIVEGGNRMQALIRDLLEFSRVTTRGNTIRPTDSGATLVEVLRDMQAVIGETGASVDHEPLPMVMADPTRLGQVFANLIGNAIKYRRPDVPPEVMVSAYRVGPMVEFAVQDNGLGIEAEYFDRIFEMFRRLHTHDEYKGTGIGLAVVKKIVERHGGTIRVESTPGEGSTFFFTLPAA